MQGLRYSVVGEDTDHGGGNFKAVILEWFHSSNKLNPHSIVETNVAQSGLKSWLTEEKYLSICHGLCLHQTQDTNHGD